MKPAPILPASQRRQPADFTPYFDLNRAFRRGETTEPCPAALKAEGPPDTCALTQRSKTAKGLNASDKVLAQAIALRVVQTFQVRAKRRQGFDGSRQRHMAESQKYGISHIILRKVSCVT